MPSLQIFVARVNLLFILILHSTHYTMKRKTLTVLLSLFALLVTAQVNKVEFHVWPNGAPNENGEQGPEQGNAQFVTNVVDPVMTVYLPEHPNGLAILACPGGSYLQVWQGTEGHNRAQWYTDRGIVYAVLKYRLPNGGHYEVPLSDVHQAMRILKEHQTEYGFSKLGIQGCSAGGHLASTAATHFTSPENRPDFQILFYPVISTDPSFTHQFSCDNLMGKTPSDDLKTLYSNELQVTPQTPPAFITASTDDGLVPVRNSTSYYDALVANGVSATMCLFPIGGHGWYGNDQFPYCQVWLSALQVWLEQQLQAK